MERKPSYKDLDDDALYVLLSIHRKTLGVLEQQAASFTFLHLPAHIVHSIDQEKEAIATIKAELIARGKDPQKNATNLVEVDQNKQQYVLTRKVAELLKIPPEEYPVFEAIVDKLNAGRRKLGKLQHLRKIIVWSLIGVFIDTVFASIYTILEQQVGVVFQPYTRFAIRLSIVVVGSFLLFMLMYAFIYALIYVITEVFIASEE